jgi:UDP-N-acetylmuramate dehydrogenase
MNWRKSSLKKLTSFKIGGKVDRFVVPGDEAELRKALVYARRRKCRVSVIGAGSNILAGESGFKGVLIRLSAADFSGIRIKGSLVECGSGLTLSRFLSEAKGHGLTGVEFLAGIPGTIGGALVMNAGAWGESIGGLTSYVRVMDYAGRVSVISRKNAGFSYRNSGLGKYIILGAGFKLKKSRKKAVASKIKKYLENRAKSQDNSLPNAGCVFKNPPLCSAGLLIDACGLKGLRSKGAVVSRKHANFILNAGGAKSADVLKLISVIRKAVKRKFGVELEPELKIWK